LNVTFRKPVIPAENPYKPAINACSAKIKRQAPVSDLLYADATRRKAKKETEVPSPQKQGSPKTKILSSDSQGILFKRFERDL
jgi:hypothetical protein